LRISGSKEENMSNLWQDLRYGVRMLAKNPGFTAIAVLTLAIGIGANTAMFSVVNAVLLRPLAYREPNRIVTIASLWKETGHHGPVSAPDFHDWHDQATAFASMAYYEDEDCAVSSSTGGQYSHCALVTPEFFHVFLSEPTGGHFFTPDEQKAGAAIISHTYWRQRFGGDSAALGQSVQIFGRSLNIVGVAPPDFRFPDNTDVWIPANTALPETTSRSGHNYRVVARLKAGVTLNEAQAEMTTIAARLEQLYPPSNKNKSAVVVPMRDDMVSNVRLTLELLLASVCVVLLIACANIANLLLAKATGRAREIAIRAAMGASRTRIVRQLLTESALIALAAGAAGVAIAILSTRILIRLAPHDIPRLSEAGVDLRVLAFTCGVSLISTVLFGIAPAFQATRLDLNQALQQSGPRGSASRGSGRLQGALVVSEVALSVVLLAGAGLLIRSLRALLDVQMGFRPEKVVVMDTDVPASGLEGARHATQLYKRFLAEASAIPGVASVAATRGLPHDASSNGGYWIDSLPPIETLSVGAPQAVFSIVTPNYFHTIGIPLESGRDFADGDSYDAPFVAVINEALAKQAFPKQNPIGHTIFCGMDSFKGMRIVGVAGNTRQFGPSTSPWPEIFMPYEQHPLPSTSLIVVARTPLDPGSLEETLRRTLRDISPEVPSRFSTMQAELSESVAAPRFRALLIVVFALLALALAMAGIYGVMAYSVAERTREIGIRIALGAQPGGVLHLVLGQGMRLVAAGLVVGLGGAFVTTRLLTSMLFEVKPFDPVTFAGACGALFAVALVANYIPARRATHVDPMVALRHE
jgi:putative ABC transport system permease protein